MTPCPHAVAYPDEPKRLHCAAGTCRGGVVETPGTARRLPELLAAGWRLDGRTLLHADHGSARIETALWLMDNEAAKRAAGEAPT